MNEVLYILMRNDMDSLNPGKGMAQAAHASNHFMFWNSDDMEFKKWCSYRAFGVTIVLSVNIFGDKEGLHSIIGDLELYP